MTPFVGFLVRSSSLSSNLICAVSFSSSLSCLALPIIKRFHSSRVIFLAISLSFPPASIHSMYHSFRYMISSIIPGLIWEFMSRVSFLTIITLLIVPIALDAVVISSVSYPITANTSASKVIIDISFVGLIKFSSSPEVSSKCKM